MKDLVLIGAGGHCRSVIDVIESTKEFRIAAIVDKKESIGKKILSYEISHCDADLPDLYKAYDNFLITVGQIKSPDARIRLYESVKNAGKILPAIVASTAYVSRFAKIGPGTVIMHESFINANAVIGENCIINTKALIEHDVEVGNHCHISTAAVLNGGVIVESGSFIGSNAVIRESLQIPTMSIIPAGSAVLKRLYEK